MKLNVKAFALACGVVWGLGMFLLGLMDTFLQWGTGFRYVMSTLYLGYTPTVLGSIIGAAWGLVDGGCGGLVVAWLYNKFVK
ncbi:MAG: bacteriophage holin [Candidatus Omnitrophota bacterium]